MNIEEKRDKFKASGKPSEELQERARRFYRFVADAEPSDTLVYAFASFAHQHAQQAEAERDRYRTAVYKMARHIRKLRNVLESIKQELSPSATLRHQRWHLWICQALGSAPAVEEKEKEDGV